MIATSRSRLRISTLTALVSLLLGAASSTHAETTSASGGTVIASLPYQITSSGVYYLASDLSVNANIAHAINITAPNVTLDLNGHTLAQNYANDNATLGIYVGASNVTVRNGTITGFLTGVNSYGNSGLFEDLCVIATTWRGLELDASHIVVRRCRVSNIGGEMVPNLAPYAIGILLQNGANISVSDCDVTTLTPGPGCAAGCIYLVGATNALVVNNRLTAANNGLAESWSSGKFRDNLAAGISPYAPYPLPGQSNLIDAGNNQ